jgi:hypothetical protein
MQVFVNFFTLTSDVSLVVVIIRKVIVGHSVVLKIVKIICCGHKALIYTLIHFLRIFRASQNFVVLNLHLDVFIEIKRALSEFKQMFNRV